MSRFKSLCNLVLLAACLLGLPAAHAADAGAQPPAHAASQPPAAGHPAASPAPSQPASQAQMYGAIDLGSRGVKAYLYSFAPEGEGVDARVVWQENINTQLVSGAQGQHFTDAGMSEASHAVAKLLADMKEQAARLKRSDVTYYVVGSSGVAVFDNHDDLKQAVDKESGLSMSFVDAAQEAYYGLLSAVPSNRRDVGASVDIGSNNTKAACLDNGKTQTQEVPYGTIGLRKAAMSKAPGDKEYPGAVDALLQQDVTPRLTGCLQRGRLYFLGGAAWATATFTRPEEAKWGFVSLTRADIDGFLARLKDGTWNQGAPKFKFAPSVTPALRAQITQAAEADRKSVGDVFSREDLIAGVSLLRSLASERADAPTMYFVRNGNYIFGWALEKFMSDSGAAAASPPLSSKATYFAGVDLGSRGVKAFVYSFTREGDGLNAKVLYQKSISTKLVSTVKDNKFTPEGIAEARDAVLRLVTEMREFAQQKKIEPRFYLVASSGVAAQENKADLKAAVDEATKLELEFVDARTEAIDAARSAVPQSHLQDSVVVDVGSGNTKLGCFTGETFNSDEVPFGSTTLAKAALEAASPKPASAPMAGASAGDASPPKPAAMSYEDSLAIKVQAMTESYQRIRINTPCFGNRSRFYFVGGAPWATTTFTKPELVRVGYVAFTRKDVDTFLARLRDRSWDQQDPPFNFPPKTSLDYRAAIRAENAAARADVQNVFSREALMAGASIVKMVLDSGNPAATVYFVRNGNYLFGYALAKYKDMQAADEVPEQK